MGIEDFITESNTKGAGSRRHEYYDKLNEWVVELENRFPIDLNIDEVTVSKRMTKTWGKAYENHREGHQIKMSADFMEKHSDEEIKRTLLHEMVHVYFYQQGHSDVKHSKFFRWVAGRVGADMTHMSYTNEKWQDCITPFLDEV